MRWLAGGLLLLLAALQYRLWVGDGSLAEVQILRDEVNAQRLEHDQLRSRNQTLEAEVIDLREGLGALEERARSELGMIKQGEIFLQVIEEPGPSAPVLPSPSPDSKLPSQQPEANGGLGRREAAADVGPKP